MKAIERIYQYIDYKGIKPLPFEKKIGLSNGYLGKQIKRNADLGEGIILRIIENCPDINPLWLLTGEGEMLKGPEQAARTEKPPPPAQDPRDTYIIELQKKQIAFLEQEINAYKSRLKECEQRELRAAELAMERKRKLEQSGEKTK